MGAGARDPAPYEIPVGYAWVPIYPDGRSVTE